MQNGAFQMASFETVPLSVGKLKKEENSFKTLQLTLQVYLRFQPELLLRLLLWLGLVWLRELGDRSDLHAPIFHHYGTAFIHGHEANPIPLRMVAVALGYGAGLQCYRQSLEPRRQSA